MAALTKEMQMLPQADLATFDNPMALLMACHDNVRRFSELTARLASYVEANGATSEASEAANRIIRYFSVGARHHHCDEEEDLFPALRALGDAALNQAIDHLEQEHAALEGLWVPLHTWMTQIADGINAEAPLMIVEAFVTRYPAHADEEEREIYPHASLLPHEVLADLGMRMKARRHDSSDRTQPDHAA